jgi:hypothetical protein
MIQSENFYPFFGVVEDIDDPEKLGRIQVRVYGLHPRNKGKIPTEDLPWMSCVTSNSTGSSGIGHTPSDYRKGANVFGYFLGSDFQTAIIIGSITGIPYSGPNGSEGFFDPDEKLPYYPSDESDVNRLAREPDLHWIIDKKASQLVTGVDHITGTWSEPDYNNQCTYPMNHVYESLEEGHVHEYDDTEGAERIHEWHKSGSYREVISDGTQTVKVIGDGYKVVMRDNNVYVKGICNLTVGADCNTKIYGDWNIFVGGDVNKEVVGNETVSIGKVNKKTAGTLIDYDAPFIYLN